MGDGTRPTSDRAREGLFSSLQSLLDLQDAHVLDLYAGSGALGLEAISRGAAFAVLVEQAPPALAALRANVAVLGLRPDQVSVVAGDVLGYLARQAAPGGFDLVLLDPPYADPVEPVLEGVVGALAAGGIVVAERASRGVAPEWPEGLGQVRSRRYGQAVLWYARRTGPAA